MVRKMLVLFLAFFVISTALFAATDTKQGPAQVEEKELTQLRNEELQMRITVLERDMGALIRRITRMEDKVDRIDRDLKDLRFR